MRKNIFLVITCLLVSACNAQENKNKTPENTGNTQTNRTHLSNPKPETDTITVVLDKSEHNFGTISQSNGIVKHTFTLKNTGKTPLIINKVSASCGCTVPEWSKEPIAPGKQGVVKVAFDPHGRSGNFTKHLTVYTNGNPSRISLKVKGTIE